MIKRNIGFDNRIFLTEEEWRTYIRRKPARYIKYKKKQICEVCGELGTIEKPLENAHIIGFDMGIHTVLYRSAN